MTQELSIITSQGLDDAFAQQTHIKVQGTLAGAAVEQNETFAIDKNYSNSRVDHLLKRPYITTSIIKPIRDREGMVRGVLNLHTKKDGGFSEDKLNDSLENIKNIEQFLTGLWD